MRVLAIGDVLQIVDRRNPIAHSSAHLLSDPSERGHTTLGCRREATPGSVQARLVQEERPKAHAARCLHRIGEMTRRHADERDACALRPACGRVRRLVARHGIVREGERPGWSAEVERLIGVVQALPPARVLDVGCGTGFLTQHLRGELVALDQSARMVEIAAARMPNARVVQERCRSSAVRRRRVRPRLHEPFPPPPAARRARRFHRRSPSRRTRARRRRGCACARTLPGGAGRRVVAMARGTAGTGIPSRLPSSSVSSASVTCSTKDAGSWSS